MAVLTVSQINRYMASRVREDGNLKHFMIKGEISNFAAPSSGHLYFSLKDADSVIKAVMFVVWHPVCGFCPKTACMSLSVRV